MIFFYFANIFSAVFPVSEKEGFCVYKKLLSSTVVMVKTHAYHRVDSTEPWVEVKDIQTMTSMNIYKAKDKQHVATVTDGKIVFRDAKYDSSNIFFFTTNHGNGNYTFEFDIKANSPGEFGIMLEMFEGKPYNPEIVSGVDYQMNWLTQKIQDLLDFAKNNFEIQRMGDEDEAEYEKLYAYIFTLLFRVTIAKIIVLLVTIFYFNKAVKNFFVSKKIVK
ncbi:hypothetical protein NGRA_1368 [Nosema granulosis]|uniref:GOLD domain-containing protein n=1 Tax=Nosema granulosis TaxID=83296 RepID=A0A9P6GYM2_9MICR|nr:hypothetical protein NGRA_1368 [Nosema granulosis]